MSALRGFSERETQAFQITTKRLQVQNKFNINLKPKIIAKHLLCVVVLKLKTMIIEIGNKPLKLMIAEDLLQLVIIEGCCPFIEYEGKKIWSEPEIIEFDNKMFSDTLVLDYNSIRLKDNVKSVDFTFYFDFKKFQYHYTRDYKNNQNQQSKGNRLKLESLKFLISKGYDVPLYNNA